MTPEVWEFLQTPLMQAIFVWLLVGLIVAWAALRIIGGGKLLAFNNATGRVLVSQGAIKGLIVRTCGTVDGIAHPQPRIYTRGGKLRVRLYIQLRGNTRLSDIAALIQDKLDLALRQNLGIERIGRIDVVVTDIQPAPKKQSSNTAKVGYPWEEA